MTILKTPPPRAGPVVLESVPKLPRQLDWTRVIAIGGLHIGSLLAFFPRFFSWEAVATIPILWFFCGCLGITLCFHRLLTHRSFKTFRIIEYILTILGTLNWQGGPIQWVGTHRLHHRDSDQPGDPHSPKIDGFNWAHMWWAMCKDAPGTNPRDAAKDLERDWVMVLIDRYFYVFMIPLAIGLYLWGGWPCVVWGICVRTTLGYHTTWFVNSAAHTFGYRNFETTDNSRNNWWVALTGWGEGWHNNHHAQQRSAAHGMRWFEIDMTYWIIKLMESTGLAWNVVEPDRSELK